MKLNKIVRLVLFACIMGGAVSCQKETLKEIGQEADTSPSNTIKLSFDFSKSPIEFDSRAGSETDEILSEESEVKSLLYAVFKGGVKQHFAYIPFNTPMQTGQSYSILNLSSSWFDTTTEVFALANIEENEALKKELENETSVENWRNHTYEAKLNADADKNDSRVVNKPVMAGYLNLKDGVTDKISVKMERVYCRIWFSFIWQNHPLADNVTIDEIKISGLHQRSKLFNYHRYIWEDTVHLKDEIQEVYVIKNQDKNQLPFMGRLTEAPYFNQDLNLNYIEKLKNDYNILCRFPWKDGKVVTQNQRPVRYYVYSLQRGGTGLEQDPLIELKYHYVYTSQEYGSMTLHKKATARLYDKISEDGKKHHGLLRNYTYRLNCIVNTVTNTMELQVISVPWYRIEINDIPSFE